MAYSKELGGYYTEAEEYYRQMEEPEPMYCCSVCGEDIYEGDCVWKIGGVRYCDDCAQETYMTIA